MKKSIIAAIGIMLIGVNGFTAQEVTLDKIYSGKYYPKGIEGIASLRNGEEYAVIDQNGIAKYSYKDQKNEGYIVQGSFEDYTLSDDETKILLLTDKQPIYRHSFYGKFEVKDLKTGKTTALNNGNYVQEPAFSPDGSKVAFIADNNIFYQNLSDGSIVQITNDGAKNKILNGLADWVYEEEFGHARQYEWDKSGNEIVFVKSDESNVPEMTIPSYKNYLYPKEFKYKYPKAGENNSVVSLFVYHLDSKSIQPIDLSSYENYYIPKIFRTNKANNIVVATSNRHQNKVDLISINTNNASSKKLFSETDKAWIETDNLTLEFLNDNSILWTSERDGYRHLYWYMPDGKLKKQVTKGKWEITDYYGYNPNTNNVYVQTTQNGSINRVIAKINIKNGKSEIISESKGINNASFSQNFKYFINTHSNANTPPVYELKTDNGKTIKVLENNERLLERTKEDLFVTKEFFTIKNNAGEDMNAWILKPKNFDPHKKYPLFIYQYSGPGSQQVNNSWDSWNGPWFNLLVQKGYIVACVDGRGTGFKGAKYKKATYLNLGKYEIEDQIAAAKWFGQQPYIDDNRIGIFGWSFGGYMSCLAMTKGADVFKMGIAVAPVTNWRFYDSVYTERFLRTPQENPQGYDTNSPTSYANLMKGKFLLIHGTADDNVHFENSMVFEEALIQNKKQFQFMAYPDKNHGIYGGYTRHHLYEKMTDFILNNL